MHSFGAKHYVPCLRWKQGEYTALSTIGDDARKGITPLIEVAEKGWDFETETEKKTIDEHLAPVAKRVRKHWGRRLCFVDLIHIPSTDRLAGGIHPVDNVFFKLADEDCQAVPVTGIARDSDYQAAVMRTARKGSTGLCMRVTLEEATSDSLSSDLRAALTNKVAIENCDLVLDVGAVTFTPLEDFAELVAETIQMLPQLKRWRTFTLLGTSFPETMGKVGKGISQLTRSEWLLYKRTMPLLTRKGIRVPTFGDYGINHPEVLAVDMRKVSPSANIRYTINDAWLFVKGSSLRRDGPHQLRGHCQKLISSGFFLGADFSEGDKYILDCASGKASTGNPTTWRKVGTIHHLEKLMRDVSSFFAA